MQVHFRPLQLDIQTYDTSQTGRYRDLLRTWALGIGKKDKITGQPFLMGLQKGPKAGAADLFLSLNEKGDAQGRVRIFFEETSHRRNMDHQWPLVVGGSPAKQIAIPHGGFERGSRP